MEEYALICDAIRTPFGRYGGAWHGSRRRSRRDSNPALMVRNQSVDWRTDDDVISWLRQSGWGRQPQCGSHGGAARRPIRERTRLRSIASAARAGCCAMAARTIRSGRVRLVIAGGVESMSRAPFV